MPAEIRLSCQTFNSS